jgi:pyruvate,orthophosphate dikinase
MAKRLGITAAKVKAKVNSLHEFNPMLGHRGCRLSITYPEICKMQVRAIMEAACSMTKKGIKVYPEIMIPLIGTKQEFDILADLSREVAKEVIKKTGVKVNYLVGTMMEIPRATLVADTVAENAEFFSFGTNDLTQMAFGYSRDDIGTFLPEYLDKKILVDDPFASIDEEGVGQLVKIGVERGRATRPDLKVGVCGEHGGDPASVKFFASVGLDYVSCSPYRVPVARLAAAQAALKTKQSQTKSKAKKTSSKKRKKGKK